MLSRATQAFAFSIIGAAYQMISFYVAALTDRNTSIYNYSFSYETLFVSSFFVIWSASHILEDWKGRITWPSIILAIGIANLSAIILGYYAQNSPLQVYSTPPSIIPTLAIIPGPLLMMIGGILGLTAREPIPRKQGQVVLSHA